MSKYMSNERVTCLVLIGCGLSLEGVAGVDQEGPPGDAGAKAGFEETTELLKLRHQVSSSPGGPVFMPMGFPCRRNHFKAWS